ncbi:MAG: oligopeptide:H+ symporter [Micrococcaceae bacterium]
MEEKKQKIVQSVDSNVAEMEEAAALTKNEQLTENEDVPTNTKFFGHPMQMGTVAGVEMWCSFSYYGLTGVLLLYIYYSTTQGGLGLSQATAVSIVGAMGGGAKLASVANSWLADRVLGRERVLFITATMTMLGHLTMAFTSGAGGLALGLFLVAYGSVGTVTTSIIGSLYRRGDIRLNSGFALYYMGVNIGAFLGPLITGWLQTNKGFHYGFGAAAIGMALGLAQYSYYRRFLPKSVNHVANPLNEDEKKKSLMVLVGILLVFATLIGTKVLDAGDAANSVVVISIVSAVVIYTTMIRSDKITSDERTRVYASIPLFISQIGFWTLYQQQFTVLTIYSDQRLNRHIGNWVMPVSWVQSINPVYIILLSGFFAGLWAKWKGQPRTSGKFAWANILIGLAYFMFLPFANKGPNSAPILLIAAILFVFTIGEMFLSPTGLAVSTQLAPKAFTTRMVAIFSLAAAIGTAAAGSIAEFYDPTNEVPYFTTLGISSIILGCIIFALNPWINKRMEGIV